MVGYNVQVAVDTENHLIVTHDVTTTGSDRSQLAKMAKAAKAVLRTDKLEAVADRGYYHSEEILACEQAGIAVTLPKPMTSGAKAAGRFGKQDFVYLPEADAYRCPAGERLKYYYTNAENGQTLHRYWTNACMGCASRISAPLASNAASPAGTMRTFSKPCSSGLMRICKPCGAGARRSSIHSVPSKRGWARRTF